MALIQGKAFASKCGYEYPDGVARTLASKLDIVALHDDLLNTAAWFNAPAFFLLGRVAEYEPTDEEFGLDLPSNKLMMPGLTNNNTGKEFMFRGSPKRLIIFGQNNEDFDSTEAGNMYWFSQVDADPEDLIFTNLLINGQRFNIGGTDTNGDIFAKRFVIANNILSSGASGAAGDCVLLDFPRGQSDGFVVANNIMRGGTNTTDPLNAGTGVHLAGVHNTAVIGNVIRDAGMGAIMLEDRVRGVVIMGNVGSNCLVNGIRLINNDARAVYADPKDGATVIGNYVSADTVGSVPVGFSYGKLGINHGWSDKGSQSLCALVGNRMRDFDTGMRQGRHLQAATHNVAIECDLALEVLAREAIHEGTMFARDCTTGVEANQSAWVRRIAFESAPTTLLSVPEPSQFASAAMMAGLTDGFVINQQDASILHNGIPATQWFTLVAAADFMDGRLAYHLTNNAATLGVFGDVFYDGTVFDVRRLTVAAAGNVTATGVQLRIDSGNLQVGFAVTASTTFTQWKLDFSGRYFRVPANTSPTRVSSFASATALDLGDIADAINTTGKYPTKQVWDSTNGKLVVTGDGAAGALWYYKDGTTPITPV